MGHCQEHVSAGETVRQANACYTNNKNRMRFRDIVPVSVVIMNCVRHNA